MIYGQGLTPKCIVEVNFNLSCIFKNPNINLRLIFGLVNSSNTNLRYVVGGQNVIRAKTNVVCFSKNVVGLYRNKNPYNIRRNIYLF